MMMNLLLKYYVPNFAPEDGGGTGSPSPSGGAAPSASSQPSSEAPSSTPSTPSPSPTSTTPAEAPTSAPGGFDFGSIFEDSPSPTGATEIVQPPPQVTPPPTPPPAPTAPVVAEPATATPPAPAATQPATATPQTAAPQSGAEFDRYDPGLLASHLARNEAQALDYVAENVFKLSPQDVEALETNAVNIIPKLLARVFVKSQQNVLRQLADMVPTMIQRQTLAMRKNDEGLDKFYAKWPMIKKAEHNDLVTKYGAVYRQMHPSATLEQMIEDLGPMIMMAGRIPPQTPAPATAGAPVNPAAQRTANGRAPPPSPFVPAGGAAPVNASTVPEVSPWEAMFKQE